MTRSHLIERLAAKGSDQAQVAQQLIAQPALLAEVLAGIRAPEARIKYGCEKVLRLVAEQAPALLYPHFGFFVQLQDSPNSVLKWGAILTIAHLARVDTEAKFERIFNKYFAPIDGPDMITAANVIRGAGQIAVAKPALADRIARRILRVERAKYRTAECQRVAIGHAIDALSRFYAQIQRKGPVLKFVERQRRNSRPAVRKRAEEFMRRFQK